MKSKMICMAIVLLVVISSVTGCSKNSKITSKEDITLKWWLVNNVKDTITSYNDVESLKIMQEKTGVKIEYIHPSAASSNDQFNIMIASCDYPDLIQWYWNSSYVGGIDKAYSDGVVIKLNDYLKKLPNYQALIESKPDYESAIKSYDGSIYVFSTVKEDVSLNSFYGPLIREDWLKKLGLGVPQTIEDWYNVLTAFKTKDPNGNGKMDEIPFASFKDFSFHSFSAAWGVIKGQFHPKADGTFVYGSMEPEFKDFIIEMNKWYKEGLIDPEFASVGKNIVDANMTNGTSGATIGYLGSQQGNYIAAKSSDEPGYSVIGAAWPSLIKGNPQYCAYYPMSRLIESGYGTAITTKNKHIEETLRYMDYCYSDEATALQNWGIEGVTYEKDGDSFKFTNNILRNSDGLSPIQAITPYALTIYGVPAKMVSSKAYSQIMHNFPQQKDAAITWAGTDMSLLTPDYPLAPEERERLSRITSEIETYENEMFIKMVMGAEPISKFDEFVARLKVLGIEEAIDIRKAAYERSLR